MLRRDLIATVLSLLSATGIQEFVADLEAVVTDEGEPARDDESEDDGSGNGESEDGADEPGTQTRTAVVDRIEDGTAVLLFEDEETQETVEAAVLPEAAREAGVVLRVPEGDSLALATVDRDATARRRQNAQDRFDDLAEPAPGRNASANDTGP